MRLALYSTIYPGVEAYLKDWYRSVREQTDLDFELWIGLDQLSVESATRALGEDPKASWVPAAAGDSPARVRQRALERLVAICDAVVLVDSDDILHPCRVASARESLKTSDLAACALRLVDQGGADLGLYFTLPPGCGPTDMLPRNNVFGLSNTSYRSSLLRSCLPIPSGVALVDWYLATRAWLTGARLAFDTSVGMDYRQHAANMTRVRPPFSRQQVISDCERVRRHFQFLCATPPEGALAERTAALELVAEDVETFRRRVVLQPARLERYLAALNNLQLAPLWWSCVAHPALQHMWTSPKETS